MTELETMQLMTRAAAILQFAEDFPVCACALTVALKTIDEPGNEDEKLRTFNGYLQIFEKMIDNKDESELQEKIEDVLNNMMVW